MKTAFVLGAGLGTRLRPLTADCPKPLLPVGGKPAVMWTLDRLVEAGVERIIINTHHCAEKYDEVFPKKEWKGAELIFLHEPILLETGGGIKNTEAFWRKEEDLLVHNGDVLTTLPLEKLTEYHETSGNEVTLGLRTREEPKDIGFDAKSGKIKKIKRDVQSDSLQWCLFTGLYVVNRRFLARFEQGKKISVIPIFLDMLRSDAGSLGGVVLDEGVWHDIGTTVEEYKKLKDGWHG
ncbi:MAG: nucleotidyltransferase family protein [Verrucomicrobiota bacterium]